MKKKKAPTKSRGRIDANHSTDVIAQRHRLLEALRKAGSTGISTIHARHKLNIMMPAARVHSLRHDLGLNVQMFWTDEIDPAGFEHHCALYILMPGKWKGAA